MSRINIIIIGSLASILLIFSCIYLNSENYYDELHPKKVEISTKKLHLKSTVALVDRETEIIEDTIISSIDSITLDNTTSIIDNKITLLSSEKNSTTIYPSSESNRSTDKPKIESLENNLSLPNKTLLNEIQVKISTLLANNQITFKKNSGVVSPAGKKILDEIFMLLDLNEKNFILEVNGHTDAGGKRKVNQWISQKRADGVKKYLIKRGIPSKNIIAQGFGESQLLFTDKPYSTKNRRVEIYIKRKQ